MALVFGCSSPDQLERDAPRVFAPPPVVFLAGLPIVALIAVIFPSTYIPTTLSLIVGIGFEVAGGLLARSFFRAFRNAGTTISPYAPSTSLVTSGAYRFSRNPGYLGMSLAFAGICILIGNLWTLLPLLLIIVVVDRGVIACEEQYLERAFGESYRTYKHQTRRWL